MLIKYYLTWYHRLASELPWSLSARN